MILRTWAGSYIETKEYHWSIYWYVALGWLRAIFCMRWDEWRGSLDGRPVMYIKRLFWFPIGYDFKRRKILAVRMDLHKMVRADDPGCFHTHPANAIRIILKGGYTEERLWIEGATGCPDVGYTGCRFPSCSCLKYRKYFFAGNMGIVHTNYCHRIAGLWEDVSYSLWIRGPIIADVQLIGDGWPADKLGIHPERN